MEKTTSEQFRKILDESGFKNYSYADILNLLCNYSYMKAKQYKRQGYLTIGEEWSTRADKIYGALVAITEFQYL